MILKPIIETSSLHKNKHMDMHQIRKNVRITNFSF